MKNEERKAMYLKIVQIASGLIVFVSVFCIAYCLLQNSKLSGTEFISFVIAFAVIGLIIAFISEVKEFSIAGNIVKLKEVKSEAEKSIVELKTARTETFRFLLSLSKRYPGGFGSGDPIDDRVKDFWFLYNKIVEFKCEEELKRDILEVVNVLLEGQLRSISSYSSMVYTNYCRNFTVAPDLKELEEFALNKESIEISAKAHNSSFDNIRAGAIEGLNEYKKLYELRNSLEK